MKKQQFTLVILLLISTLTFSINDPIKIYHKKATIYVHLNNPVKFEYNSDKLNNSAKTELKILAKNLILNNDLKVEIGVFTDTRNDPEFSLEITGKRANLIKQYLVKCGVNPDNLIAKGYGDTVIINKCKPFVKCTDAEHKKNRRVEFKILNPEKLTDFKMVKK